VLLPNEFQPKLTKALELINRSLNTVKKAQEISQSETKIDIPGIKIVLDGVFGESGTVGETKSVGSSLSMEKYSYLKNSIEVQVRSNLDGFVIFMSKASGDVYSPLVGEITVPAENGYDQSGSIRDHVQDFLDKVNEVETANPDIRGSGNNQNKEDA